MRNHHRLNQPLFLIGDRRNWHLGSTPPQGRNLNLYRTDFFLSLLLVLGEDVLFDIHHLTHSLLFDSLSSCLIRKIMHCSPCHHEIHPALQPRFHLC